MGKNESLITVIQNYRVIFFLSMLIIKKTLKIYDFLKHA